MQGVSTHTFFFTVLTSCGEAEMTKRFIFRSVKLEQESCLLLRVLTVNIGFN